MKTIPKLYFYQLYFSVEVKTFYSTHNMMNQCKSLRTIREGLNKKILINLVEFSTEVGGSTHSTKIINFDQKINTSQNDPNALKHEINQYKYFPNWDPYPPSHLAEYLAMSSIHP